MAPAVDQLAAPVARTIVPSAWLFALTGSLLLGQLVAAADVILPADLLFFFLFPLVLLINPASTVRFLGRLIAGRCDPRTDCQTPRKIPTWALLAMIAGLMFALGYYRHRQLLFPNFPPNHLRSVMIDTERVIFRRGAAARTGETPQSKSLVFARRTDMASDRRPRNFRRYAFERPASSPRVALRRSYPRADSANRAEKQRQSWRLQLCHLSIAT